MDENLPSSPLQSQPNYQPPKDWNKKISVVLGAVIIILGGVIIYLLPKKPIAQENVSRNGNSLIKVIDNPYLTSDPNSNNQVQDSQQQALPESYINVNWYSKALPAPPPPGTEASTEPYATQLYYLVGKVADGEYAGKELYL